MKNKNVMKLVTGMLICVGLISFTGCKKEVAKENANGLEKVTVVLDWTPNTNHTGLYVAKEKGYFESQGLDVEIVQPAEGSSLQIVAAKKGDFAITYQEDLTYARTADNPLPVKAIATIIKNNTSGFSAPASKGIKTVKDFEGKVYGGWGGPSENAILKAVMEKSGADFSKLTTVEVGNDDFFIATQNNIDFEWTFEGWANTQARLNGVDLDYIPLRELDERLNYYTPIIAAEESTLEEKPDMVRKFLKAATMGYEFCMENPEESAEILVKEANEIDIELAKASQEYLKDQYQADSARWGEMEDRVWDNYTDFLYENQLIAVKMPASEAYTNEFLPEK